MALTTYPLSEFGLLLDDAEMCRPPCVNGVCNEITRQCDCSPGYTGISCDQGIHTYIITLSLSHDTHTHTLTFTHLLYSFIISLPCPSLPLSLSPPSSLSLPPPPPSLSLSLSLSVAEVECDEDSMRTITFGNVNYDLRLCRESKWHSTVVYTNVHDCYVQQPTPIFSVSMGYQKVGVVLQLAIAKQ